MITLQPITSRTGFAVCQMKADPTLVASNIQSLAEAFAYYSEHKQMPIAYAVCHNGISVGFIMALYNPPTEFAPFIDNKGEPYYYLWRNMIDEKHQNKGYGRAAMELLIAEAKAGKYGEANAFYTGSAPESPVTAKFYGSFGFVNTGEIDRDGDDYEYIMRLAF